MSQATGGVGQTSAAVSQVTGGVGQAMSGVSQVTAGVSQASGGVNGNLENVAVVETAVVVKNPNARNAYHA